MAAKIVSGKERSLVLGVLGSGQAGSRLAEAFYKLGYDSVAVNTAMQDLKFIDIPDSNKLLLEYGLGGAASFFLLAYWTMHYMRSSLLLWGLNETASR